MKKPLNPTRPSPAFGAASRRSPIRMGRGASMASSIASRRGSVMSPSIMR